MKKSFFLLLIYCMGSFFLSAQKQMACYPFAKISISGSAIVKVVFDRGDFIEIDSESSDVTDITQKDDKIKISTKPNTKWKNHDAIIVHATQLTSIELNGATSLKILDTLKASSLKIISNGACKLNANILVDTLETKLSGVGEIHMGGYAKQHHLICEGTSQYDGKNLFVENLDVKGSGISKITVWAQRISADLAGMSLLYYLDVPGLETDFFSTTGINQFTKIDATAKQKKSSSHPKHEQMTYVVQEDSIQTVKQSVIIEKDDIFWDEWDYPGKFFKKRKKFDAHWAGFELAMDCYGTQNFSTELPTAYDLMNQDFGKSIGVNLNLFDISQRFGKSQFGIFTGLGMSWYNYRFHETRVIPYTDDGQFQIQLNENPDYSYYKSKLASWWLRMPLMLEWHTPDKSYMKDIYLSAGIVGAVKLRSHSKQKYELLGQSNKGKSKIYDDFYLNPFKADIEVRAGFGPICLFADFGLLEMFQKNRGPKLYSWTVGITLIRF